MLPQIFISSHISKVLDFYLNIISLKKKRYQILDHDLYDFKDIKHKWMWQPQSNDDTFPYCFVCKLTLME